MESYQPDKNFVRICLLYEFHQKNNAKDATKKICSIYGDVISIRQSQRWFKNFKSGNFDTKNKPREKKVVKVDDDILKCEVEANPTKSIQQIADTLGYSWSSVQEHLKKIGKIHKQGVWIPHELSDDNKGVRVQMCDNLLKLQEETSFLKNLVTGDEKWIMYSNQTRQKQWLSKGQMAVPTPKPSLTARKVLLSVWWDCKGIIYYEVLPYGRTITAEVYCSQLDRLNEALKSKRPTMHAERKIYFQHDNARPHTALITRQKLIDLGWKKIDHPPYSPDLAPSDYHLFRSLQHFLSGKKFNNIDEVKSGLAQYFASKPESFYSKGIKMLLNRWKNVLDTNGEYVMDNFLSNK